jgi:TolB-like protein/Tfp pilus assembly protein PilF
LALVVGRCLDKEPDRRYPRAGDVYMALRALQGGDITARPAGRSRWPSRRRTLLASLVVVVGALAALDPGHLRQRLTWGSPTPVIRLGVLPFQNLTGEPQQEYFSDGLTDDMITELGRLHPARLSVIARTSIMRYKGTDKSLRAIGGELGVDYLLETSVRREAGRVRINAALIRVGDETQQWAESYEREATSILALQSDVARGVAGSLALALLPGEMTRLGRARPVDPEAYDAHLKGRQYASKLTSADLDTALRHFELALQKDPDYALAYTGLATVWSGRQQMGFYPAREATPRAKDAIFKALALDDSLAEAHLRLAGSMAWSDWDWAGAEREFQKSIALNPSYPDARAFYSHFLHIMKRPAEAMEQMDRALELDPFNPLFQALGGVDLLLVRRYDDAIGRFQNALKMAPGNPIAVTGLQNAFHLKGLFKEALAVERDAATKRGDSQRVAALEAGEAEGGYLGAMRRVADLLAARSRATGMAPANVAVVYLRAQDQERAFEWLERSFAARDPNLPYVRVWPYSDGLRRDPRFHDLLKRMGLSS